MVFGYFQSIRSIVSGKGHTCCLGILVSFIGVCKKKELQNLFHNSSSFYINIGLGKIRTSHIGILSLNAVLGMKLLQFMATFAVGFNSHCCL